jgi:AbrB family looped-hinge helix DNA binding protein
MPSAIVSTKGWVVVPKEYRLKYGLKPGAKVQIIDYGGGLSIVPLLDDPIAALRGMFAEGPSLTVDLLTERQRARAVEGAKTEQ